MLNLGILFHIIDDFLNGIIDVLHKGVEFLAACNRGSERGTQHTPNVCKTVVPVLQTRVGAVLVLRVEEFSVSVIHHDAVISHLVIQGLKDFLEVGLEDRVDAPLCLIEDLITRILST